MDVTIGCLCPPKGEDVRHPDGDTVTLRDRLDYMTVTTIRKAMALVDTDDEQVRNAQLLATCTQFYMLLGITGWTLVDDKGKAIPVSHAAIRERLFPSGEVETVSTEAEQLYNPIVLLPLVNRASASRPPSRTPSLISPTSTPPSPLKRSRRSSTSSTPTDDTETTSSSLDGVSSSSQSAA